MLIDSGIKYVTYQLNLTTKKFATRQDLDLYVAVEDNRFGFRAGDAVFVLDQEDDHDALDAEERQEADDTPLYWDETTNQLETGNCADVVDYRSHQTPVRNQLDRGTCVCFASLAALEFVGKQQGIRLDLSEQYANWLFMKMQGRNQCDDGLRTTLAVRYLKQHGVCRESLYKYEDAATVNAHCNSTPPHNVQIKANYGVKKYTLINGLGFFGPSINNTDYLEVLLCHAHPIVFGTHVAWGLPDVNGVYDVILDAYRNPLQSRSGHAMLMVGYNRSAPLPYFICKNSWGVDKGVRGYYYLSYDYVRTYAKYGFVVQGIRTDMNTIP